MLTLLLETLKELCPPEQKHVSLLPSPKGALDFGYRPLEVDFYHKLHPAWSPPT